MPSGNESNLKQTSDGFSEECQLARKSGGTGTEAISKPKNGQDREFGVFIQYRMFKMTAVLFKTLMTLLTLVQLVLAKSQLGMLWG